MDRMRVNKIKFGKFIAERREKIKGVNTQVLLAKKLSVSKGTIGKIETGERLPSFDLFIDLADKLLMTPAELIMIMAEREVSKVGYMEMNDWLYEKLLRVIREYQDLTNMTPEQLAAIRARIEADRQESDLLADITPDVEGQEKPQEKPQETPQTINHDSIDNG